MLRHSSNSQTPFARGAGAWFHDVLYLAASFTVWNWRKSRYRRARGEMRCPCQSLSDSGRADESRCEASYYLKDPRRFSIVCPALKNTAAGLRCHLPLEDVRPYWGRAFLAAMVAAIFLYILGTTTVYSVFRLQGITTVRWVDCSWPGNWSNLSVVRANHHRSAAEQSLAQSDSRAAIRSLSRAVNLQPENWRNALLLAELYESIGQFAASEEIFGSLAQKHPDQIKQISAAHHDAVLASQRFDSLQALAFDRLLRGESTRTEDWFHTLLVATMLSDNPNTIRTQYASECDQLSADHLQLLGVVAPPAETTKEAAINQLRNHRFEDSQLIPLRWRILHESGAVSTARDSLQQDAPSLPPFDAATARWVVSESLDSKFVTNAEWENLVASAPSSSDLLRLCAASLQVESPPSLNIIKNRIPRDDQRLSAVLWMTAAATKDTILTAVMATRLETLGFSDLPVIDSENLPSHLASICAKFSIPHEIHYALMLATRPLPPTARFE